MKNSLKKWYVVSLAFWSILLPSTLQAQDRPNILWITSEDNSPLLGCYGDKLATTPNLDKLASRGFRYTHAYANAPVCAPSRNTIITGVYANSNGNQNMRSTYRKSDLIKLYPQLLRQAGYYCTNRSKEDFNIDPSQTKDTWNELGAKAHYKNRPKGSPFFSVFNLEMSHESSLFKQIPADKLRHKLTDVTLPLYFPDTPEIRHDVAQYYDKIEDMDAAVGKLIQELQDSGEAENTIVFYYADHGGILGRSKRYLYDTGTRVPFIIHIPEKFKSLYPAVAPGSAVDRLMSFVDLAPTLLSMVGAPIPAYMQGHAFLGAKTAKEPAYVFQFRDRMGDRFDMSRAVVDKKYRYVRNYMPYRIYGQYLEYSWGMPSMGSWEAACKAGNCNEIQQAFWKTKPAEELYDHEKDPWEVHNLATDPAYQSVLMMMRTACHAWMLSIHDTGFIPEAELIDLVGDGDVYDYMRQHNVPLKQIIEAADLATQPKGSDLSKVVKMLDSDQSAVRYWGAAGLLMRGEKARPALYTLKKAAGDPSISVANVAAEALYKLGEKESGQKTLLRALDSANMIARSYALNVIDYVDDSSAEIRNGILSIFSDKKKLNLQRYDHQGIKRLFDKWGLSLRDYGIE